MLTPLSIIALIVVGLPSLYLLLLALASMRKVPPLPIRERPTHRFLIAIPAHDEAAVIGATVQALRRQEYPDDLFEIHVVADYCTDQTADMAREAGAFAHERNQGQRSGKGIALAWLFERVLVSIPFDAVVVFDADTRVRPDFLRIMDARLHEGHVVIQGNHVISNPNDGWFPALTWAMFQIDNRFQNLGRSNLSWSAKNMGDSICLRANILRQMEWAHGLTDDYELRQRLLLDGIRIFYEPRAIAYGEAAQTWSQARAQRARWLRGTRDASGKFARQLLRAGLQQRRALLLDGGLQAVFPSYSTLTLLSVLAIALQLGLNLWLGPVIPGLLIALWIALAGLLFLYPLLGLALEKAPVTAYLVTLSGPAFILWRTLLVLSARRKRKQVVWIRTAHGKRQ